ncbi:hypothetical protein HNY73_014610 [Argiope bruennichi]|uniref:Uncharacterized protein n=1 Tax=Argiope bruennichi TaxID=94029 RepID=A0A8T0EQP5_ARGBR|nr:hypothetical protein HNY73_014610 [Argiope bruennichi]
MEERKNFLCVSSRKGDRRRTLSFEVNIVVETAGSAYRDSCEGKASRFRLARCVFTLHVEWMSEATQLGGGAGWDRGVGFRSQQSPLPTWKLMDIHEDPRCAAGFVRSATHPSTHSGMRSLMMKSQRKRNSLGVQLPLRGGGWAEREES